MSDAPIQPGSKPPAFTLQDQHRAERTLDDFTGKGKPVCLFFYCLDWSPVCTPEMERLVERFEDLRDHVELVGISTDHLWSHKAWADHLGIEFPLLADWGGDVTREYGLWHEDFRIAERATLWLDAEGVVQGIDASEVGEGRDIDAMVEKARKLAQG